MCPTAILPRTPPPASRQSRLIMPFAVTQREKFILGILSTLVVLGLIGLMLL